MLSVRVARRLMVDKSHRPLLAEALIFVTPHLRPRADAINRAPLVRIARSESVYVKRARAGKSRRRRSRVDSTAPRYTLAEGER